MLYIFMNKNKKSDSHLPRKKKSFYSNRPGHRRIMEEFDKNSAERRVKNRQ